MQKDNLLIAKGNMLEGQLKGVVALVTGGGGGIGLETARSLLWLGAKVVIAEIDKYKAVQSERELQLEFGKDNICSFCVDISNEGNVKKLYKSIISRYGKVDVIINNATIAPTGAVHTVGIDTWDRSYNVNLRGPVLLTTYFLPDMIKNNSGILIFVPSSGAAPYLGTYEVFKTAQVELGNTLAGELEGTGIKVFSVGPGIVKTDTADAAIHKIAHLYGKTVEEFYKMSEKMLLTAEQAGAGFAAAVALADKYNGLEVSSMQALIDIGIDIEEANIAEQIVFNEEELPRIKEVFALIKATLEEQAEGWSKRPVFERQWVLRDFKKSTGYAPEYFIENNKSFALKLQRNDISRSDIKKLQLDKLHSYYLHQLVLLRGYEKNQSKLEEYTEAITSWVRGIEEFNRQVELNNRLS